MHHVHRNGDPRWSASRSMSFRGPYPPLTNPAAWREPNGIVHEGYRTGSAQYPMLRCGAICRFLSVPIETPTTCIECLAAAAG